MSFWFPGAHGIDSPVKGGVYQLQCSSNSRIPGFDAAQGSMKIERLLLSGYQPYAGAAGFIHVLVRESSDSFHEIPYKRYGSPNHDCISSTNSFGYVEIRTLERCLLQYKRFEFLQVLLDEVFLERT